MQNRLVFFLVSALTLILLGVGCNPRPGTGTVVRENVGIRDFYVVRSTDDGQVVTRDIRPEPRPREAITGDDYFQIKLEHIYIGDALGRGVGNAAIITQINGILPDEVTCSELDVSELGFHLNQRERSNLAGRGCAYKHVVAINPIFSNGHVTFDSAFITPPFRMGMEPVGFRFIIGQLNDTELAQALLSWAEEQVANLDSLGVGEMTQWQSQLVDIGFTVANYMLDYASLPDYVFEFETDFVPIETVGGVTTPQNIFMGGDFIIVAFPRPDADDLVALARTEAAAGPGGPGALLASRELLFDSGRLYWRSTGEEYRAGPYIVFKVVRQSRFPDELPVTLARLNREIERGAAPADLAGVWRGAVLDLQDAHVINETEGRYLLDVFEWFANARALEMELEEMVYTGARLSPAEWPRQMASLSETLGTDLALIAPLLEAEGMLERLAERIYENYERNPGLWQAECIALRGVTQNISDSYEELRPVAETAFEDLQLARLALQRRDRRSRQEQEELDALGEVEIWAQSRIEQLPQTLDEPLCPALRR